MFSLLVVGLLFFSFVFFSQKSTMFGTEPFSDTWRTFPKPFLAFRGRGKIQILFSLFRKQELGFIVRLFFYGTKNGKNIS